MRFPPSDGCLNERRQVLNVAVKLDDLIQDCDARPDLSGILRRARREVSHLLRSEEQILSRHEALAG